jgi:hypothetical protein
MRLFSKKGKGKKKKKGTMDRGLSDIADAMKTDEIEVFSDKDSSNDNTERGKPEQRKEPVQRESMGKDDFRILVLLSAICAACIGVAIFLHSRENPGEILMLGTGTLGLGFLSGASMVFAVQEKRKSRKGSMAALITAGLLVSGVTTLFAFGFVQAL